MKMEKMVEWIAPQIVKQIYRRISRGLVKKRRGRPTKIIYVPEPPGPEVLTMGNCAAILLS